MIGFYRLSTYSQQATHLLIVSLIALKDVAGVDIKAVYGIFF